MMYSNIPAAQATVFHCKQRQIQNIVISPGSRNAPLTLGFTEDPFFSCFSVVDERSAAFFALGIAQQSQKPVVLLCTSGSALLNYYPAISEAYYSNIPLIVLSADRPAYKIDIGDGQTIRQEAVFEKHIGFSANLKLDVSHSSEELTKWGELSADQDTEQIDILQSKVREYNDELLNKAIEKSVRENCPVHINIPFEEPLYGLTDSTEFEPQVLTGAGIQEDFPKTQIDELASIWNSSKKKLIICGVLHPGKLNNGILEELAEDPSVAVLTETTSNLMHPAFIRSIDSVLAPIELAGNSEKLFDELRPELVITIGGMIVSKKVKAFLRRYSPSYHWHVHQTNAPDTFRVLTHHLKTEADSLLSKLLTKTGRVESDYGKQWEIAKRGYRELRKAYLSEIPFSDLSAFDRIFKAVPDNYQLQLANSSTVRYSQLFDMKPANTVFCNRGTSGIDGSTSTAVGAALKSERPTLLISGDLSFLYDINGLWNEYLRPDFRIIVINNGGGGIFRILPGRQDNERFEKYFETVHHARIDLICAAYGLEHIKAPDTASLEEGLRNLFKSGQRPKLLEIVTSRTLNDKILLQYFEFISSRLYS